MNFRELANLLRNLLPAYNPYISNANHLALCCQQSGHYTTVVQLKSVENAYVLLFWQHWRKDHSPLNMDNSCFYSPTHIDQVQLPASIDPSTVRTFCARVLQHDSTRDQ
jgi:hypothetical protein